MASPIQRLLERLAARGETATAQKVMNSLDEIERLGAAKATKAASEIPVSAYEGWGPRAGQSDYNKLFNPLPEAEKSAYEPAKYFEETSPNFELVGSPQTPIAQGSGNLPVPRQSTVPSGGKGFELVGEPQSGYGKDLVTRAGNEAYVPGISQVGQIIDTTATPVGKSRSKLFDILGAGGLLTGAGLYGVSKFGGDNTSIGSGVTQSPEERAQMAASLGIKREQASTEQPIQTPTQALVKALKPSGLAQQPSTTPSNVIDFGTGIDFKDQLRQAQEASNQMRLGAQLGQVGEQIGSAISGYKPDVKAYEERLSSADRPLKQLAQQMEMQKNDPKSPLAQAFKQYAKKLGFDIKGDMAPADAERIMPMIFKGFEAEETRRAHMEEAKFKRDYLATQKEIALGEKRTQADTKRFDEMGKRLTSEIASSRSAFGKAANNVRAAEAIEALVDQFHGNLNNMDNRQIQELARSLDTLLSQGQATISGTEKLVPETIRGDFAKMGEYITNQAKGANQAAFVNRMVETVRREKELARDQIKRTQGKVLANYKDLESKNPEKWRNIMSAHGLIDEEEGGDQTQSPVPKGSPNRTIVKKGYNPQTNKTQFVYSDGTKEIVDGKQ